MRTTGTDPRYIKRAGFEELSALWLNKDKTALVPVSKFPGQFKDDTSVHFSAAEVNDIITMVRAKVINSSILTYATAPSPGTVLRTLIERLQGQTWADENVRRGAIHGVVLATSELEKK